MALLAAPAIVRVANIMPVSVFLDNEIKDLLHKDLLRRAFTDLTIKGIFTIEKEDAEIFNNLSLADLSMNVSHYNRLKAGKIALASGVRPLLHKYGGNIKFPIFWD